MFFAEWLQQKKKALLTAFARNHSSRHATKGAGATENLRTRSYERSFSAKERPK
jgi:hypothetical protein